VDFESLIARCDSGVRSRLFGTAFHDLAEPRRRAYLSHLFSGSSTGRSERDEPKRSTFGSDKSNRRCVHRGNPWGRSADDRADEHQFVAQGSPYGDWPGPRWRLSDPSGEWPVWPSAFWR
jgi:hypothetical protein